MTDLARVGASHRSPARPGPGPIAEALVQALEPRLDRRVAGRLPGDHRARGVAAGLELDRIRVYEPGDDVRRMDWAVTARTSVPHVREHLPERQLTTWLLLDVSASMHFGTADRRKADVAEGVALVVGRIAARRAGRFGLVLFGDGPERVVPPATGRRGFLQLLGALRTVTSEEGGGTVSPARAMRLVARSRTAAGLVVVASDFRGDRDWRTPLADLAGRHAVVAVEVGDPREDRLVDVGDLQLVDPETGRGLRVDTGDVRLRDAFEKAAAADRASIAAEFRRLGVRHVRLSTEGGWLTPFAHELARPMAAAR
jgi:uncharacterized protein (DUF58 family)